MECLARYLIVDNSCFVLDIHRLLFCFICFFANKKVKTLISELFVKFCLKLNKECFTAISGSRDYNLVLSLKRKKSSRADNLHNIQMKDSL